MKRSAIVVVSILLAGCIGTSSSVRAPYTPSPNDTFSYTLDNYGGMTPEGRQIFEARLHRQLGGQLTNGPEAKRINVKVEYYRMRNGATRFWVGVMAGRDRILSTVTVTSADGKPLGTLTVDSANSTAMGTGRGLIEGHADEIAAFVRGGLGGKDDLSSTPATSAAPPDSPTCKACQTIGN